MRRPLLPHLRLRLLLVRRLLAGGRLPMAGPRIPVQLHRRCAVATLVSQPRRCRSAHSCHRRAGGQVRREVTAICVLSAADFLCSVLLIALHAIDEAILRTIGLYVYVV